MEILCVIYDDYSVVFWFSVFWFRQQMLCGISNIFSRQTIRDLSKKSSALWSSYVLWNPKYSIITLFMENETYSPHLSWLFDNFSISVFWKMQLPQNRIFSCVLDTFIPFIMAIWSFSISCVLEKFKFFKIEHFRIDGCDLCHFEGILDHFKFFSVWVHARGALWDLKYFFSTNKLRIVKQMTASSRIICPVICGKYHFQKSRPSCINTLNLWDSVSCSSVFDFQCCGPGSRCSAGSQILFPDQQSESYQKSLALGISDALWNIQLLKNHEFSHYYDTFMRLIAIILSF